jgi:hypothetical protein
MFSMVPVNDAYRRVRPVHPAAAYIGGKKQLARRLVAMIAAVPHETKEAATKDTIQRADADPKAAGLCVRVSDGGHLGAAD